jgi:hypothetical protein
MLKAALTAQDRGESPVTEAPTSIKTSIELLHNPAFPCLRHAKGDVIENVEPTDGYEVPDLASVRLAGTAPSASLADNVVCPQPKVFVVIVYAGAHFFSRDRPKPQRLGRDIVSGANHGRHSRRKRARVSDHAPWTYM